MRAIKRQIKRRRLPSPSAEVVTRSEAAAILRVSESTIIRAIASGNLPSFKLARRHLIRRADLLDRAFGSQEKKEAQTDASPSSRPR